MVGYTGMNKETFINSLKKKTQLPYNECVIINQILENHFIIGKKNKQKIINNLKLSLNIDEIDAENIYDICMNIISSALKEKIKHPFKGTN